MYAKISKTMFLRPRGEAFPQLPAGHYLWDLTSQGMTFDTQPMQHETHDPYPYQRAVLDRIEKFLSLADGYARLGLAYKRGFLLHGGPGCGKTTLARMAAAKWEAAGGIVLMGGPQGEVAAAIAATGNRALVLIDDVDEWNDARLTHAMDGLADVSSVVWLATTNHIDQISTRLRRPGRFDEVLEVIPPPPADTCVWVTSLDIPQDQKDWVIAHAEGLTPSEVRELVIRVNLYDERRPIEAKPVAN